MSPLKESSDRIKETTKTIKADIKGLVGSLTESAPRPIVERLRERKPLVLREPLIKTLRTRRENKT